MNANHSEVLRPLGVYDPLSDGCCCQGKQQP